MRSIFSWFLAGGMVLLGASFWGCSGGQAGSSTDRGPFKVELITNGFSPQLFPYRIKVADKNGNPTDRIVNITSMDILRNNVSANNDVLPIGTWPDTAQLPNGAAGNEFLQIRFNNPIDRNSVMSDLLANLSSNSGLTGNLQVLQYEYNTAAEKSGMVKGRAFIGGGSYFSTGATQLTWYQCFVRVDNDHVAVNPDLPPAIRNQLTDGVHIYFPTGFTNAADLIEPTSFVFIPDQDGDLSTYETFPKASDGYLVRVVLSKSVTDINGKSLSEAVCVATTAGTDSVEPEIIGHKRSQNGLGGLEIHPGNGEAGVDPDTTIMVSFNKPVQPRDVGEFVSATNLTPAFRSLTIEYKVQGNVYKTLYWAEPVTPGDFCNFRVVPSYTLPGNHEISVKVEKTVRGLNLLNPAASISTKFTTGEGPGIVNAPVAPEAIYVGMRGSNSGVAVIDLNGFGQGTGDLSVSNFKNNPNVGAPGVTPPLAPGTSNLDAGSEGALTLTKDSSGTNFRLVKPPIVGQVGDMAIGQPLDKVYNNENVNPFVTRINQVNPATATGIGAFGNSIQVAPIPNPPKIKFPPPNPARAIFAEEPTVASTSGSGFLASSPPCVTSPPNLLGIGDPLVKKDGIFGASLPGIFVGPQPPPAGSQQPITPYCPYASRQQIGHFLYVIDRDNQKLVVLNSNRFTVLKSFSITDPYSLGLSPNLKMLAVTSFSSGKVSFIDVDPSSPTFHTVVGVTKVGEGPMGVAWQPQGEDLLVCNSVSNTVSILAGTTLQVRKNVSSLLNRPFEVAVDSREVNFGFNTGIYFAYILNTDGTVAIFESGPSGVNGIGFDDVIGVPESGRFRNARTLQPDVLSQSSAVWVAHQDNNGLGQISHLELTDSPSGPIPVSNASTGIILPPTFRQRQWNVNAKIGGQDPSTPSKDKLSGNAPSDIAFDDIQNNGAFPSLQSNQVSNIIYAPHSSKDLKRAGAGGALPASQPRFIFIANPDVGRVDVFQFDTGILVRSIKCPGATVLCNYWRQ